MSAISLVVIVSVVGVIAFLPVITVRPCAHDGDWIGCTFREKESISLYYLGYGAKSVEGQGQFYYDFCTPKWCSNL